MSTNLGEVAVVRKVWGSKRLRSEGRRTGGQKVYAYCIGDFAALLGMTEDAVRKAIARGHMNPADLGSVVEYFNRRGKDQAKLAPSPVPPPSVPIPGLSSRPTGVRLLSEEKKVPSGPSAPEEGEPKGTENKD